MGGPFLHSRGNDDGCKTTNVFVGRTSYQNDDREEQAEYDGETATIATAVGRYQKEDSYPRTRRKSQELGAHAANQ